jgi:hypothetical protein
MTRRFLTCLPVLALALAACTGNTKVSTGTSHAPHMLHRVQLTGNELRYGGDFDQHSGIVYQPDVVVIEHGADAVRSVSDNGLLWTLAADAPGVDRLAVGKIMLATSLGSGRVLKLGRDGDTVQVLLGPVALTDVIRDADLGSAAPIPLSDALYYGAPKQPGTVVGAPRFLSLPTGPTLPPPSTEPPAVDLGDFQVKPYRTSDELGLSIYESHGSGHLRGTLGIKVQKPTVTFRLVIRGSKVIEASVRLHGAIGIHVAFEAAEMDQSGSFANKVVNVPLQLTIPLGGFRLTVTQSFDLGLALSGRALLTGDGEYGLRGDLAFGVIDGKPAFNPVATTVTKPLDHNVNSYGVASNSITLGYSARISIGIGAIAFSVGAWYQLRFGLTAVSDTVLSDLSRSCVTDSLTVDSKYGIGYSIPDIVAAAVNLFLSIFGAPKIAAHGGLEWGPSTIFSTPAVKYCPHKQ